MGIYRVPNSYDEDPEYNIVPVISSDLHKFKGSELYVFVCLALSVSDPSCEVEISHSEIAIYTGLNISTVSGALQRLAKKKYIDIIEWEHSRGEINVQLRWRIYKRDGYKCVYCGKDTGPFQLDHVMPVSKGGRDTIDNLVTSCPRCNRKKSNKVLKNE